MTFEEILKEFSARVQTGDGDRFAELFTEDGVYHDIFYGEFKGREAIAEMLRLFHKGGKDFIWELYEPAEANGVGYAQWLFSYTATHERAAGRRITFDGVGVFHLKDGLIARYEDFSNGAVPLRQMNTPPELMDKMLERWQGWLEAKPRYAAHQK